MDTTTVTLHTKFQIGPVDERIFGGFAEHMGRCIYEGLYDPDSAHADEDGFRRDVAAALAGLRMPLVRYPGGNFASGYHWMDGVGPKAQRPRVRELAWQSIEPNHFGTDEFLRYCRKLNWQPMLTVNLGTAAPEEAGNWLQYCNCPPGTRYADMRAANGAPEPYAVKLWCLGNEMYGQWQLGCVPARDYAIRAQQASKIMKDADPTIETVVCGSAQAGWSAEVLDHVGGSADYLSLHQYVGNPQQDTPDFLAVSNATDRFIEEQDAICRFIQAKHRSPRRAWLCFDEWNVWYRTKGFDGQGRMAPHLLEEIYNLEDALVVAGFLHSFLRHADVLKIANIAQIVNVIAPVLTQGDELLIQSIYYPFEMFSKRREGISLRPIVQGPGYQAKTNGAARYVDASAIWQADKLHMFLTNRSLRDRAAVRVTLADRRIETLHSAELLTGPDAKGENSFQNPDVVVAKPFDHLDITDGVAVVDLPPLSFVAATFGLD